MGLFNQVFPAKLRERLRNKAESPNATDDVRAINKRLNGNHPFLQTWRIHLSAWLDFCEEHVGLDRDRMRRLQILDDWRSWNQILNELRIPYFLARVYGMRIDYIKSFQGNRTADVQATSGKTVINVEVKTPGQEPPIVHRGARWLGKDTRSIEQALRAANKQFSHGKHNVLAIGTHLLEVPQVQRNDIFVSEAIYGHEVIASTVDTRTGRAIDEPHTEFMPDGRLQHNRFTRIGAVLVFGDGYSIATKKRRRARHKYHCTVYHNPYAEMPIPYEMFWGTKQLLFDEHGRSYWKWPDGITYTFGGY
ncbi:MAG: hypothetical protein SVV80_11655 [Planctomycetota bacterium]|nr:hypothetical protein [Planctomycetota bacterium]